MNENRDFLFPKSKLLRVYRYADKIMIQESLAILWAAGKRMRAASNAIVGAG